MDFEHERFRKFYIRDTTTWLLIPWQARCVLAMLLRKVDEAGRLEFGNDEMLDAVAVATALPPDVVEPGIAALLGRGVLTVNGRTLTWPRFAEGQLARKSNALRQAESRLRGQATGALMGKGSATRNVSHPTRNVSESAFVCRDVSDPTQNDTIRSDQNRKEEIRQEGECEREAGASSAESGFALTAGVSEENFVEREQESAQTSLLTTDATSPNTTAPSRQKAGKGAAVTADEREVYEHWIACWKRDVKGSRVPNLSPKRLGKIRDRLKDGYRVDDLKTAIDGAFVSPFHCGIRPDGEQGPRYQDLELICRSAEKTDAFLEIAEKLIPKRRPAAPAALPKEPSEPSGTPLTKAATLPMLDQLSAWDRELYRSRTGRFGGDP